MFSIEELKRSFKEKLPTEDKYKYKVLITVSHKHLVTRFRFLTSCNSDSNLNEIMDVICNDICKNFPRGFSWSYECDKENMPPDMIPIPWSYGILI